MSRRSAVDLLVEEITFRDGFQGPCWLVHRLNSRALIVPVLPDTYAYAFGLRRDTVTAALRARLVAESGGLQSVPQWEGGGQRWSWWDGAKGSTLTLALTEAGERDA